jgi:predicted membrane-bound mannosyltransferase
MRGRWIRGRWIEEPVAPLAWSGQAVPTTEADAVGAGEPGAAVGSQPAATLPEAAPADSATAGAIGGRPGRGGGWWDGLPRRYEIAAYVSLVAVALFMRFWDLGSRALHHDESLHAYFSWEFYSGKGYTHNPLMHGPWQFDAMASMFWLLGDTDFTARLMPALFGTGMVLLPLLLRHRLGNVGALITSVLIAFSPALLYYSRFAREDIYMGFWTLALVGLIWRYLDERKNRWLYIAAAVIALGFATKENQFMVVAIMGLGMVAIGVADIGSWIWGHRSLREWGPAASVALVLGLLTLPLVGAASGIFQKYIGLTLTAKEGTPGAVTGAPDGGGYAIAIFIGVALLLVSIGIGLVWRRGTWLRILVIFWAIYITLHTTFFTNMVGVGTGTWQALGYWIAQQDVARGNQPWYYYFIIVSIYEFLPWTVAIGAAGYYAFKGDVFTRFLVFWAVATFIAYTIASEKMPWLLVHVSLPLLVLAGKALGDVATGVKWREALSRGGLFVFLGLPLVLLMVWRVIYFKWDSTDGAGSFFLMWGMLSVIGVLLALFYLLTRRIGTRPAFSVALAVAVAIMLGLTVRAGVVAAYVHGDIPQEMLVYTQTAPDIPRLAREIRTAGVLTGDREKLKITIDAADGFTWPWAWYLRKYANTGYPDYDTSKPATPPDSEVVVVNYRNKTTLDPQLADGFTNGRKIVHRWWFPEEYRDLTPGEFFGTIPRPDRWRNAIDYFMYRKMPHDLGRVESYVYFKNDIPLQALE